MAEALSQHRSPSRVLAFFTLAYLVFVIYGSWVPLDFSFVPLTDAVQKFASLPFADQAIESATDWATNSILLIPFTFLLGHLIRRCLPGMGSALSVILAAASGVLLAFFLEFSQIYFPSRTVSQKDLLALSLGGMIGSLAQLRWGRVAEQWLDTLWQVEQGRSGLIKALHLYLLIVLLFSVLPLDLTVSVVEFYNKWKEGRLVLVPFGGLQGGMAEIAYELASDLLLWLPVGVLLAMERRSSPFRTAIHVGLLAIGIEFAQLFVYSRVTDITDPLLAALGGGLGGYLASREKQLQDIIASRSATFRYCTWCAWAAAIVAVFWFPFDFAIRSTLFEDALDMLTRLPFLTLYQGTEFNAINEIIRKTAMFVPGGLIFGMAVSSSRGSSRQAARGGLLLMLMLASIIEIGQLFLPGKVADTTDILLFTLGGWLGLRLAKAFRSVDWQSLKSTAPKAVQAEPRLEISAEIAITSRLSIKHWQIIAFAVLTIGLAVLIRLPGVPYNIKELVSPGMAGLFSIAGINLALLWSINGHFIALQKLSPSSRALYFLPLWLIAHALVTWGLLRLSVPLESIHDIVGSPVLNWAWDLEMMGRYVALHSAMALALLGAIILTASLSGTGQKGLLAIWGLWSILLAWPLHSIIVSQAATDNLTELMRGGGDLPYAMLLFAGVFLASLSATLLASLLARRSHIPAKLILIVVATTSSIACLWFGSEPMILKYGKVFSAWQFLLSPDRNNYIVGPQLWLHFAVVFTAYIALVALLHYPFWKNSAPTASQKRSRSRQKVRV